MAVGRKTVSGLELKMLPALLGLALQRPVHRPGLTSLQRLAAFGIPLNAEWRRSLRA